MSSDSKRSCLIQIHLPNLFRLSIVKNLYYMFFYNQSWTIKFTILSMWMCVVYMIILLCVFIPLTDITLRTTSIFSLCNLPLRRSMRIPIFYPTYLLDLISTMSDTLGSIFIVILSIGSQLLVTEIIYLITIVKREISLLHSQEHHG